MRDAAGRLTGLVGISKDVTERRQAEEAFREFVTAGAAGDLTLRGQEGSDSEAVVRTVETLSGKLGRLITKLGG